jgi:predicted metal-binding membrane protein
MIHLHPESDFVATAAASTAMMAVMMTPSVWPWIGAYHRFAGVQGEFDSRSAKAWATTAFAGGYLAAWALFSVAVTVVHAIVRAPAAYGGALLIFAGVFQLSPFKQACLSHCRNPLSFLLARWQDGPTPAFRLGMLHGGYCVGCCWALMLTAFAAGLMSLWWMAALALLTFVEQVVPWGARTRVPVGLALIAAGLAW